MLRLLAALFGIGVLVALQLRLQVPPNVLGKALFNALRVTVTSVVWVLGPLLTADCISREQREGTLKLLFLTPLRSTDIVLSKVSLHALRAITLLLAFLPMAVLPVLLGGVSWQDGLQVVVVVAGSMVAALSAGLVASAFTERWGRALFLGLVLSLLLLPTLASFVVFLQTGTFPPLKGLVSFGWLQDLMRRLRFGGPGLGLPGVPLTAGRDLVGLSLVWASVSVLLAAWGIKRSWREEPPSKLRRRLTDLFCSPWLWERFVSSVMRSRRDINPIHWLGEYSWSARMSKWGWCCVIILAESVVLAAVWSKKDLLVWHYRLLYGLAIGLAFIAAASFRQERETGLYELLAVTPIGGRKMIAGRARGLWRQMLPAFIVLVGVFYFTTDFTERVFLRSDPGATEGFDSTLLFVLGLGTMFVTVAAVGMALAATRLNLFLAWGLTVAIALVLPWVVLTTFLFGGQHFLVDLANSWGDVGRYIAHLLRLVAVDPRVSLGIEVKYGVYLGLQLFISFTVGAILAIRTMLRRAFV